MRPKQITVGMETGPDGRVYGKHVGCPDKCWYVPEGETKPKTCPMYGIRLDEQGTVETCSDDCPD